MAKIDFDSLRERIIGILKKSGLTQEQWATILNVSQPSVSHYLKGRIPPLEVLEKLCMAAGIPLISLLYENGYLAEGKEGWQVREKSEDYGKDELLVVANKLSPEARFKLLALLRELTAEE